MSVPNTDKLSKLKAPKDGSNKKPIGGNSTHSPANDSDTDTTDHLFLISNQIHDNIKFADQKAAFFSVINIALLGYLWTLDIDPALDGHEHAAACYWCFLSAKFFCCLCVAIAVFCSVLTIVPRGNEAPPGVTKGIVDPVRIILYGGKKENWETRQICADKMLRAHRIDDINKYLAMLVLNRSHTNAAKYYWVKLCFIISSLTWALVFIFLVTAECYNAIEAGEEKALHFNLINLAQSPAK